MRATDDAGGGGIDPALRGTGAAETGGVVDLCKPMKRTLLLVLAGIGLTAFTPAPAKADRIDLGPITIYRHQKHHRFYRHYHYRRSPYYYEDERRRAWRERSLRERYWWHRRHYPRYYDAY